MHPHSSPLWKGEHAIGESKFKTGMPPNVLDRGLSRYIKQFTERCLSERQVEDVLHALGALKADGSLTRRSHLKTLRERHHSVSDCPRCGAGLVRRNSRKGERDGSVFLGCSRYPQCRYTRPA
jgi:restriction system protein